MKRDHGHEEHENSERWLLSYADFITLLMVFFIIMYSMSVVDQEKYQALAQSLNAAMSGGTIFPNPGSTVTDITIPTESEPTPQSDSLDQLEQDALTAIEQQISKYLQDAGLESSVDLSIDERGLVVSLKDTATFDSGSASVKSSFVPQLIQIAEILNSIDNYVRIEGHTDDVPIKGRYQSNWELSTARATSLVELFINNSSIIPAKLSAVGYGEYRPVASNDTAEGRARNRRVDIIVIRSQYNGLETVNDGGAPPSALEASASPDVADTSPDAANS